MGKLVCRIQAAQLDMLTGSCLLPPDAVPAPLCCLLLHSRWQRAFCAGGALLAAEDR